MTHAARRVRLCQLLLRQRPHAARSCTCRRRQAAADEVDVAVVVRLAQLTLEVEEPFPVSIPTESGVKEPVEGGRPQLDLAASKLGLFFGKVKKAAVECLRCSHSLAKLRKLSVSVFTRAASDGTPVRSTPTQPESQEGGRAGDRGTEPRGLLRPGHGALVPLTGLQTAGATHYP